MELAELAGRRLAAALIVLAALASLGYTLGARHAPVYAPAGQPGRVGLVLDVKVYRNGVMVEHRRVDDDPLLRNFAAFLVKFIGSRGDPEDDDKITQVDGTTVSGAFCDNGNSGDTGSYKAKIRFGTGTTPVTPNDYTLENEVASTDIQNADIEVNGTRIVVHVYGSYVFNTAYNITEIGLSIEGVDACRQPFLIARDVLAPIQVQAGDAVVVNYYITING